MSRPRTSPAHWPKAIPRRQRQRTDAIGCFSLRHQPLPEEFYDNHEIELSGNLLAVAVRGGMVLTRGEEMVVVREGSACLMTAGSLAITEVPTSGCGGVDIQLIFFDDRIIRRRFEDIVKVERLAEVMPSPGVELSPLPGYMNDLSPVLLGTGGTFPRDATKALTFAFNHGWASSWAFLKSFFARRRQLHLFLEDHVLPVQSPEDIQGLYPSGRREFRRDYRSQYDIPLARWRKRRRLQVARMHLRHGPPVPIDRIARGVGYENTESFRQQFRARYKLWPEDVPQFNDHKRLNQEKLYQVLAPFWHQSYPQDEKFWDATSVFFYTHNGVDTSRKGRRLRRIQAIEKRRAAELLHQHDDYFLTDPQPHPGNASVVTMPSTGFAKFIEHEPLNPSTSGLPASGFTAVGLRPHDARDHNL